MLPPSWKGEVQKAVDETTKAGREEWESEQNKQVANISAAIEALNNTPKRSNQQTDSNQMNGERLI